MSMLAHLQEPQSGGEDEAQTRVNGRMLLLALYFGLLAIFIALTALSPFDPDKVRRATESLEQSFSLRLNPLSDINAEARRAARQRDAAFTAFAAGHLAASGLTLDAPTGDAGDGEVARLSLTVPAERIFLRGLPALNPETDDSLFAVAAGLQEAPGWRLELTVSGPRLLSVERAAELGRVLSSRAPQDRLLIGMRVDDRDPAGRVSLVITKGAAP